eukprot:452857_1
MDTASVKSLTMDSEVQLGSHRETSPIVKSNPEDKEMGTKCDNLTFNCIYQILDLFIGLSFLFWAYCLFHKSMHIFSQLAQPSFTHFISSALMTVYLGAFGLTILIYTFHYPFHAKSLYFTFYARGIFYIFVGNSITLIVTISDANAFPFSDYGIYTAYYIIGIGLLHLASSLITNRKCGAHCCFIPSPWCQLNQGKQLPSQIGDTLDITDQMTTHLKFNDNAHHKDHTLSQLSHSHEQTEEDSDGDIDALLAIRKELRCIEKERSPPDVIHKSHTINIEMWEKKTQPKPHKSAVARKSMNDMRKSKPRSKSNAKAKPTLPKQHTLESPKAMNARQRRHSEIPVSSSANNGESFRSRLSFFKDNAQSVSTDKINKIKSERKEMEKDMKQDQASKRRATIAMQTYATKAAAHSQDINTVNKGLKNITRSNCLDKMRELGLLYGIYVPKNAYQRWGIRSKLDKLLRAEDMKEEDRDEVNGTKRTNTKEYEKMFVMNLRNNVLLTKISKEQTNDFYDLLRYAIESAPRLYMLDFTRSNTNKKVLNVVFCALNKRLKDDCLFGPEEILLESNPITDEGCKVIIDYVRSGARHLKVLRLSNSFNGIGTQTVVAFCDAMETNHNIIKFSLDINYLMYNNRMDGYVKRNNDLWRSNKKSKAENMIKRDSYGFMVKQRSGHVQGRRSSVPNLHEAHPSLALIQGQFAVDRAEKRKADERKEWLKPKRSRPRGKSSPPKPSDETTQQRNSGSSKSMKRSKHKKRRSPLDDSVLSIKDRINTFS